MIQGAGKRLLTVLWPSDSCFLTLDSRPLEFTP
jgi:hypothetical protein